MKKTIFFAAVAAIFAIASCQKEAPVQEIKTEDPVFTAQIITDASKTTIDTLGKVEWETTDTITITDAAQTSVNYVVSEILESGSAKFVKASEETNTLGDGPYSAIYGMDPDTKQVYAGEVPSLPMEASSESTHLQFEVTCGLLELKLKAYESIDSIYVTGYPEPRAADSTVFTLVCPDAVDISNDTTKFFVALPAGTYHKIFIYGQNGAVCRKQSKISGIDIAANHITPVSFKDTLRFGVQLWKGGPYWATMNVDAEKSTDYGGYYAWGEISTKTTYDWTTYKWCNGNSTNIYISINTLIKYNFYDTCGPVVDNIYALESADDVAIAKWGGSWRMPTSLEWNALLNKCSGTWVTVNGVKGRKFTGTTEGYKNNSIFLPAAGDNSFGKLQNVGTQGQYWSSTLYDADPSNSDCLFVYKHPSYGQNCTHLYRCRGLSVRPVSAE